MAQIKTFVFVLLVAERNTSLTVTLLPVRGFPHASIPEHDITTGLTFIYITATPWKIVSVFHYHNRLVRSALLVLARITDAFVLDSVVVEVRCKAVLRALDAFVS